MTGITMSPILESSLRWLDWLWQSFLGLFCTRTRNRKMFQERNPLKLKKNTKPSKKDIH